MTRKILTVFALSSFLLLSTPSFVHTQVPGVPQDPNKPHGGPDNGRGNNGINNGANNTDAPFDISLGILIAAGAAIGIKKAYDKRKKARLQQG